MRNRRRRRRPPQPEASIHGLCVPSLEGNGERRDAADLAALELAGPDTITIGVDSVVPSTFIIDNVAPGFPRCGGQVGRIKDCQGRKMRDWKYKTCSCRDEQE